MCSEKWPVIKNYIFSDDHVLLVNLNLHWVKEAQTCRTLPPLISQINYYILNQDKTDTSSYNKLEAVYLSKDFK